MNRAIIYSCIILAINIVLLGCNKAVYTGNTETDFSHFPKNNKISPQKALELATPYTNDSYELRKRNRSEKYNSMAATSIEYVVLKDNYYYITKDNYPSKLASFYMTYAVKVNKNTGEVIRP